MANPDGYYETWTGVREWRKNKNKTYKNRCGIWKDGTGHGVDLNR